MRRSGVLVVAGLALAVGAAGCEENADTDRLVVVPGNGRDLVGFWTGTEKIAGPTAEVRGVEQNLDDVISFRVALRLRRNGTFRLWAFNYPVSGHSERRTCRGVWEREGRVLEFFPESVCRVLPLSQYIIGRFFPDGLTLEARQVIDTAPSRRGDIQVFFRLERD